MRLKDLREDRDLKQKDIADYLHIRQNTYSQDENGHRQLPISVLISLSKYYKVSTDYTQLKVQMETGINQSVLSKYEQGLVMPTSENLIILAKFYNTSVDFLLDLTDEQKPYPQK